MKKRNLIVIASSFALILSLVAVYLFLLPNFKKTPIVPLLNTLDQKYFTDINERELKMNEMITKKYTVIYALSEECQACMNQLDRINSFTDLPTNSSISHMLIWQNTIPLQNSAHPINYSLSGKINISKLTPYVYILNDKKEIIFSSGNLDYVEAKLKHISESEKKL